MTEIEELITKVFDLAMCMEDRYVTVRICPNNKSWSATAEAYNEDQDRKASARGHIMSEVGSGTSPEKAVGDLYNKLLCSYKSLLESCPAGLSR